jgi:hypothetical protein
VCDLFSEDVHPIATGHESCLSLLRRDEAGLRRGRRERPDEVLREGSRVAHRFVRFHEDRDTEGCDARSHPGRVGDEAGLSLPSASHDCRPLRALDGSAQRCFGIVSSRKLVERDVIEVKLVLPRCRVKRLSTLEAHEELTAHCSFDP